jgi:hypothetical protein
MNDEGCDIVDKIRQNFNNATIDKCSEKGCTLRLNNLGNFLALKGEVLIEDPRFKDLISKLINQQGENPNMCDYIIFKANGDFIICLVELKGQKPSASLVKEQLENYDRQFSEFLSVSDRLGKIMVYFTDKRWVAKK